MITPVTVPDLTTLAKNYASPPMVTKWFKSDGQRVAANEPLLVLETTKAIVEVEAPVDGLVFIVKQETDTAAVGETLAVIASSEEELAAYRRSR